jgi:peroxiredoxin
MIDPIRIRLRRWKDFMKDRRFLAVLAIGALIAVVCVVRVAINQPQNYENQVAAATVMRPAPTFEALDAHNHLVRLGSWLGRHRIIVVFFDGERGADTDSDLLRLRDRYAELQTQDVKVVAVTASIPQVNRAAMERAGGDFPFPLVSDVDPQSPEGTLRIHRHWGRLDTVTEKPLAGSFLIDRKGQVAYVGPIPKPYENVEKILDSLAK